MFSDNFVICVVSEYIQSSWDKNNCVLATHQSIHNTTGHTTDVWNKITCKTASKNIDYKDKGMQMDFSL